MTASGSPGGSTSPGTGPPNTRPSCSSGASELGRDAFVARFGDIFEASPWVAERAWQLELGPAHDTALGLHGALVRAFRAASDGERFRVLAAHPDLAGKAALAGRISDASAAEQAGSGLDALTDAERAELQALDARYTAAYGHPFIIAVRDHDKAGIFDALRRRLGNGRAQEFAEACRQVERIAELRLRGMLP